MKVIVKESHLTIISYLEVGLTGRPSCSREGDYCYMAADGALT